VRYDARAQDVAVRRGDNRGQTIEHRNVVRQLVRLGPWAGRPRVYRLPPPVEDGLTSAVLVQGAALVRMVLQVRPGVGDTAFVEVLRVFHGFIGRQFRGTRKARDVPFLAACLWP
jgi:hypothetical protein